MTSREMMFLNTTLGRKNFDLQFTIEKTPGDTDLISVELRMKSSCTSLFLAMGRGASEEVALGHLIADLARKVKEKE